MARKKKSMVKRFKLELNLTVGDELNPYFSSRFTLNIYIAPVQLLKSISNLEK